MNFQNWLHLAQDSIFFLNAAFFQKIFWQLGFKKNQLSVGWVDYEDILTNLFKEKFQTNDPSETTDNEKL